MHVLIDTCIYRQDRRRNKPGFRAVKRLAQAGVIQLHVPLFVKREFVSQQAEDAEEDITKITDAAKRIARLTNDATLVAQTAQIAQLTSAMKTDAVNALTREFQQWMTEAQATEHSIKADHAERVVDAYFAGRPPFGAAKRREDIPDSFIWETAVDLAAEHGALIVVSADGKIRKEADKNPAMTAFRSLDEFIDSEECHVALDELQTSETIRDNIERVCKLLPSASETLQHNLDSDIVNELAWKTVRHSAIPDDNNEATITMVGEAENVEYRFEETEYFGDGDLGIPFTATVECELNYYLYKGDYASLPDVEEVSISDWNDHYFDATQSFTISVAGSINLMIGVAELENEVRTDEELLAIIAEADHSVEVTERSVSAPEWYA
jgi:hypothetical protein